MWYGDVHMVVGVFYETRARLRLNRKYHYLRWGPGQNMSDPSCTIEHLVCQQPTEGNRLPAVRWVDRSCSPIVYRQLTHVLALQYLVNAWQSPIQSRMGQMNFTVQSQFYIYFSPGPSFGPSWQWGRVGHLVPLFGLRGATPGLTECVCCKICNGNVL
jgi:hypothetical protein